MQLRTLSKRTLLRLGAGSSEKTIHHLNGLLDYIELGWWLRKRGFSQGIQVSSCFEVFEPIAADFGDRPVLYLQFGAEDAGIVARWAELLPHSGTRLHVFDPPPTAAPAHGSPGGVAAMRGSQASPRLQAGK